MTKENENEKKISSSINGDSNDSSPFERQIEIDDKTGARSYRDAGGRRRFLCRENSCSTILQRQTDQYCRTHSSSHDSVNKSSISAARRTLKRSSASLTSTDNRSPLTLTSTLISSSPTSSPMPIPNQSNNNRQTRTPGQRVGTHRSFRDASGKIRFLCSIATCSSRVARQTDYFCRRHQLEVENKKTDVTLTKINENCDEHQSEKSSTIDSFLVENEQTKRSTPPTIDDSSAILFENKRQKRQLSLNLSCVPGNKINIAATTLLDEQWADVLSFIRHFSSVQISTNLNVTNITTHLIVDDNEHPLHCTITKKIVQAAVRRHIFIVSSRWLKECVRQDAFIDEHPFEMISDSHTSLRSSIQDFQNHDQFIFSSNSSILYAFAIECRQCQGSINRNELIELIHLTGAQQFDGEQAVDVLIVLCDNNDKNLTKIKEKYADAPASTIKFVTSDFLLKSIIKFELQDIDKYAL